MLDGAAVNSLSAALLGQINVGTDFLASLNEDDMLRIRIGDNINRLHSMMLSRNFETKT
jgi:hypothetical protein